MKHLFLVILILVAPWAASAQAPEYFTHHRAAISGTLTSADTYGVEMSYHI